MAKGLSDVGREINPLVQTNFFSKGYGFTVWGPMTEGLSDTAYATNALVRRISFIVFFWGDSLGGK